VSAELDQLSQQQALLTDSLAQMLQGQWVGFPSLQADILALDPDMILDPHPPVLESEAGPAPPPGWLANYDPNADQPRQQYNWTCSACSLDWVKRATQLVSPSDIYASRQQTVAEIGYPGNINETYGLMDGSGAQLQRVLGETYGVPSSQGWLSFDQAYAIYATTAGCMSGGAWYHWVGVRGTSGGDLWVANSAPGYQGVYDILSRDDFNRLGPMSCVWLDH
jgi:hypothetical protein